MGMRAERWAGTRYRIRDMYVRGRGEAVGLGWRG